MPTPSNRFMVNASWLIKLRWVAVVGQLGTIAAVRFIYGLQIPTIWALFIVISVTAISNLILSRWFFRLDLSTSGDVPPLSESRMNQIVGLVMVMDMLSLTTLLFATGGPNNPFCLFFFVNLSLCALVLNRSWAWGLNLLSVLCFGLLLYDHHRLDPLDLGAAMYPVRERGSFSLEQLGLWVAFMACSSVIVYFMTRLTDELRKQQAEVRFAQEQRSRSEKLEALGTLAAGTAHELATPLSTIAVVARDVEKAFDEHPPDFPGAEEVVEDVHLIRSQLDRCRAILDRMAGNAGQSIGETIKSVTMQELVNEVLRDLDEGGRVQTALPQQLAEQSITIPLIGVSQAIRGIVHNALDADPVGTVRLEVKRESDRWIWRIDDSGTGMPESVLRRVSEPFFTTKQPGKGMGLGVFLAKNVIERIGGRIKFESRQDRGTNVTIELPASTA